MKYNLIIYQGQFCSNCGIGSCLESNCLRKANLTHKCKEVAAVINGNDGGQNTPRRKDSVEKVEGKIIKRCMKTFNDKIFNVN